MAVSVAAGLLTTWLAALSFGGSPAVVGAACAAVAIGSIVSFGPAAFSIGRDHWGLAVLLCGVVRALGILAIAYSLTRGNPDLAPRPLYLGAAAGAIVILIAESVIAITILSSLERRREQTKAAPLIAHAADQA